MSSSDDECIAFRGSTTSISLGTENDAFVHIGRFSLTRVYPSSYLEMFHVVVLEELVAVAKEDASEQTHCNEKRRTEISRKIRQERERERERERVDTECGELERVRVCLDSDEETREKRETVGEVFVLR
jgi:hypothetical protein